MEVAIELVRSSPYQPRLTFDIDDLKEEIQKDGLLSALVVRKRDEYYELLDGERRWRTLKELGWKTVPVDIMEVDDHTARRSVYKLNKIRENYTVEEEARYFKKLADEGMKPYQIETELGVDHHWVLACLNVFKFPEDIQKHVFRLGGHPIYFYMSDVEDLETMISRDPEQAIAIAKQIIEERLTTEERRKLIGKRVTVIDEARLEAVEKALPEIAPEVAKLETPEDLERAAEALRREARRRLEESMTAEERAAREAERAVKLEEIQRRAEERKRRNQEERQRLEEQAMRKARHELKTDEEFVKEALDSMPVELRDKVVYDVEHLSKEELTAGKPPETMLDEGLKLEGRILNLASELDADYIRLVPEAQRLKVIMALRILLDEIYRALETLTGERRKEVEGIIEGEVKELQ
ncbi:Nucleoid occlusion protein [subsurface metagenome]